MIKKETIHTYIKRRKYLIWWVRDYDKLDADSIVEATLNYGTWEDVQTLIGILGIQKTALIFKKRATQKRCNYRPEIKNYFTLYFNKYAT
jgi:hypothetical protein